MKLLEGSGVRVGAAIGFPLGQNTVECKAFETRDAIAKGATEIDTVINVRALQKGQTEIVKKEIEDMVSICKPAGVICKVILETCYLTDEEKETVCRIAKEAEVDFVKTSTGFGTAGATVHDVALMRRVVGPTIGVKAAGGIRDLDSALALIQAGATRIGTSSGIPVSYTHLLKMARLRNGWMFRYWRKLAGLLRWGLPLMKRVICLFATIKVGVEQRKHRIKDVFFV